MKTKVRERSQHVYTFTRLDTGTGDLASTESPAITSECRHHSASDSGGEGNGDGTSSYGSSMLSGEIQSNSRLQYFCGSSCTVRGPLVEESWVALTFERGIVPNCSLVRAPGASSSASSAAVEVAGPAKKSTLERLSPPSPHLPTCSAGPAHLTSRDTSSWCV